jgi:hypothetical protein
VHADLFCVPQLMSGEQALAALYKAARRAFYPAFSITEHFVMSSHRRSPIPTAIPVRCGWTEGRRRATSPSMLWTNGPAAARLTCLI